MAHKDLALDDYGDLYIGDDGDFAMINSIRQAIQIKLRWHKGEWKFNDAFGIPYLESILAKSPNLALVEQIIRNQILQVDGIISVKSVTFEHDRQNRTLTCRFEAVTTSETIESEVNLIG